jgi:hypothetical protein
MITIDSPFVQNLCLLLVPGFYMIVLLKLAPMIENKLIKFLILMLLNAITTSIYVIHSLPPL